MLPPDKMGEFVFFFDDFCFMLVISFDHPIELYIPRIKVTFAVGPPDAVYKPGRISLKVVLVKKIKIKKQDSRDRFFGRKDLHFFCCSKGFFLFNC